VDDPFFNKLCEMPMTKDVGCPYKNRPAWNTPLLEQTGRCLSVAYRAGRNGSFWRGFPSMAEALGKSPRQVKTDMAALEPGLSASPCRRASE